MSGYRVYMPHMRLIGSQYFPLLVSDEDVLCPDCGGYGTVPDGIPLSRGSLGCRVCLGRGRLPFDDPRIVPVYGLEAPK